MIPLQFVNKEEGWTDINTNGEDNIAIGYDYIPWKVENNQIKPCERAKFYEKKKN